MRVYLSEQCSGSELSWQLIILNICSTCFEIPNGWYTHVEPICLPVTENLSVYLNCPEVVEWGVNISRQRDLPRLHFSMKYNTPLGLMGHSSTAKQFFPQYQYEKTLDKLSLSPDHHCGKTFGHYARLQALVFCICVWRTDIYKSNVRSSGTVLLTPVCCIFPPRPLPLFHSLTRSHFTSRFLFPPTGKAQSGVVWHPVCPPLRASPQHFAGTETNLSALSLFSLFGSLGTVDYSSSISE